MILSDKQINGLCLSDNPMLKPYCETKEVSKGVSYGQSSYGYDIRLGNVLKEIGQVKNKWGESCTIIDPENPDRVMWSKHTVDKVPFIIEPNTFILAVSMEEFNMPKNVTGLVKDKSTYARIGIAVQNTVIEAGWKSYLTLEITNPYSEKGKYQNQQNEPTPPQASTEDQFKKQGSIRGKGSMQNTFKDNGDGGKKKSGKR
jgi:dCTP deaminase